MPALPTSALAVTIEFPWMNFGWVVLGIVALMLAVAGIGRWLASTHPDPVPRVRPVPVSVATVAELSPAVAAAIAAAVHEVLGPGAVVTSVALQPAKPLSVENLMLAWSLEGRRQIYTSHKVR